MDLVLYINGHNEISTNAISNIKSIFSSIKRSMPCTLKIIDLQECSEDTIKKNILATPLLVRQHPGPELRIVSDLSCKKEIISVLQKSLTEYQND